MRQSIKAVAAIAMAMLFVAPVLAGDDSTPGTGSVTLIHTGDIHGHLVPRPNVRSDSTGHLEGGLARVATTVNRIRSQRGYKNTLLINTGDTLQGSAEAMFSRGQVMIDVLNLFGVQAHAPGNWDYLYGPDRFLETFVGTNGNPPLANWNALAANLYYSTLAEDPTTPYPDKAGQRVLPPYSIKTVDNVKVGILGLTTRRGIAAIGPRVNKGFKFTSGATELPYYINILRNTEKVDLIVLISELELANAIVLVETYPGVDVVLSADMHEKTIKPIVVRTGTILVEEGQDGTMVGELTLKVANHKLASWGWKPHIITDEIDENKLVAYKVKQVRKPFVSGSFVPGQTVTIGGNTTTLLRPVDAVVGYTAIDLHRSNFSNEDMPAVVEGSSHNFLTDAFRWATGSDFAAIRGFRYGTHIPPGPITMGDIYHFLPVAARIAKAYPVYGKQIKDQVENSTRSAFDTNTENWRGGWMFGYSGASYDLDASQPYYNRGSNIRINGELINPTDTSVRAFSAAGYWFADDPTTINNCGACSGVGGAIEVVKDAAGNPLDSTEIVVNYLQTLPGMTANPTLHRINILRPLPPPLFEFKEMQPLRGAPVP